MTFSLACLFTLHSTYSFIFIPGLLSKKTLAAQLATAAYTPEMESSPENAK
jgi:hypothetical protein